MGCDFIIIPYLGEAPGVFQERSLSVTGAHAFLLEDRTELGGEEQYVVHTLDRASAKVSKTRILRTRTVKRLGFGSTFPSTMRDEPGQSYGHVWHEGLLLFYERPILDPEHYVFGPREFSAYDPLTDTVVKQRTDEGFPPPYWWDITNYPSIDPRVTIDFSGDEYFTRGGRLYVLDRACIATERGAELMVWLGDLGQGKEVWRRKFGVVERVRTEKESYKTIRLDIHHVPGTDLLMVSWDTDDKWPRTGYGQKGRLGFHPPPTTGHYRVVRIQTGEVVAGGRYEEPGPLASLNRGCEEGLICWEGSDVVLRDRDTFRELARRTVPHRVETMYQPYLGDDVWVFCTAGEEGRNSVLYLDVYAPGLREHVASERLEPEEYLPPVPASAFEVISESFCEWRSYFPYNVLWVGVHDVGGHLVVGPWQVYNPFTKRREERGWLFVEVTPAGKFSGTSLLFFPKRGSASFYEDVSGLLVEDSRIWFTVDHSLALIDWEGSRNKNPQ